MGQRHRKGHPGERRYTEATISYTKGRPAVYAMGCNGKVMATYPVSRTLPRPDPAGPAGHRPIACLVTGVSPFRQMPPPPAQARWAAHPPCSASPKTRKSSDGAMKMAAKNHGIAENCIAHSDR